jgi:hypothetical protein
MTHADVSRTGSRACSIALACAALALLAASGASAAGDANQATCPPQTEASPGFRAYLPDCRAYELVSPAYTEGEPSYIAAISNDGSELIAASDGVFAGAEGGGGVFAEEWYQFARGSSGWSASPLGPSASDPRFRSYEFLAASADLKTTLWRASSSPPPEERGAVVDLYRREGPPGHGSFTPIGPSAQFVGASSDLQDILLTAGGQLSEYAGVEKDGEPTPVGVSSGGAPLSACGTTLGSPNSQDIYNAISADGHTVFFTALHGVCAEPEVNELYARVDGQRTLDISEPVLPAGEQCTGTCASAPRSEGVFQGAASDGSKVFFLTDQPLIDNDRDSTQDLYEAELSQGAITHLTMVSEGETHSAPDEDDPTPGEGAGVLGVVRVSQDGSRVYFVAEGVLSRAPNSERAMAVPGARNLYVFNTLTGRTAFVATLQSQSEEVAARTECSSLPGSEREACQMNLQSSQLEIWQPQDVRAAQASADGRFLVFTSLAHLTADDTSGPLVPQLFRYDAEQGLLVRVSIGHDGYGGDGDTSLALDAPQISSPFYSAIDGPTTTASSLTVTEQGAVFFQSRDVLAPQVLSGQVNVYEYAEGNVYLISDGQDATVNHLEGRSNVRLLAVSPSGQDVFFTTTDRLVPQATSTQVSWYDARVDGGFPAPATPAECEAACQAPAGLEPTLTAPPTASYAAGLNISRPAHAPLSHPAPAHGAHTRAQRLARALRACRRDRRSVRRACERRARGRYGPRSSTAIKRTARGH